MERRAVELRGVWKRYATKARWAVQDVTLEIRAGELLVILGPSGSGKTTTLRLIAGLERPDAGTIAIAGRIVADAQRFVPPEERGVGLVFQDYALFPHLTVEENVAFGLRRLPRAERRERVAMLLRLLGLEGLAERYPHELSGGQQQRVAIARALAPQPSVLLLDEPFANLDAGLRAVMREELRRLLREFDVTVVLVTHDRDEALALADRVAVMLEGTVVQVDTPERIYHEPRTRAVAQLVGQANFVPGRVIGRIGESDLGTFTLEGVPQPAEQVDLLVRPRDVVLEPHQQGLGVVVDRRFCGAEVLYRVLLPCGITLETSQPPSVDVGIGERVIVRASRGHLLAFAGVERVGRVALLGGAGDAAPAASTTTEANGHRESPSREHRF